MIKSQELAFLDLAGAFVKPYSAPLKKNLRLWKVLLVVTIFLFTLIPNPPQKSLEANLTVENLLEVTNQDRIKVGLKPLEINSKLSEAALAKANHILQNNYFAHTSPAGIQPWDFIKKTGFKYLYAGENLALNYTSAYELEQDFLQSLPHRENLLSPLFSEVGIAVVPGIYQGQSAIVTVQIFASGAETLATNN